jgi:5-methylcytosine rRNA methyltransferase NSUN4
MEAKKFKEHLLQLYGETRGQSLFLALCTGEIQVNRANLFSDQIKNQQDLRSENGLLAEYVMDPASIEAAQALEVKPGEQVLDMCAAPGGKTLILAENLFLQSRNTKAQDMTGTLIANELSAARRERLTKVIQQYVPREVRQNIFVKGLDAVKYGQRYKETFDKILLDAPCSGERHLLQNASELEKWSASRSRRLSMLQFSLLSSAWFALKPGGRIVYSTCSIEPQENDGVIEKLVKKRSAKVLESKILDAEKTKYGTVFLPDRVGFGPIYFAIIEK